MTAYAEPRRSERRARSALRPSAATRVPRLVGWALVAAAAWFAERLARLPVAPRSHAWLETAGAAVVLGALALWWLVGGVLAMVASELRTSRDLRRELDRLHRQRRVMDAYDLAAHRAHARGDPAGEVLVFDVVEQSGEDVAFVLAAFGEWLPETAGDGE
ncbi:MAG: hypothetical protein M0Z46_09605 [Actinomycetota bacterium]|jgi:hypothetical protein|nr:hypothetical protein [Actinomycetota bacterium]